MRATFTLSVISVGIRLGFFMLVLAGQDRRGDYISLSC